MKILVTGGGGFLGSAICRQLLARGDEVTAFQRSAKARGDHPPAIDPQVVDATPQSPAPPSFRVWRRLPDRRHPAPLWNRNGGETVERTRPGKYCHTGHGTGPALPWPHRWRPCDAAGLPRAHTSTVRHDSVYPRWSSRLLARLIISRGALSMRSRTI